MDGVTTGFVWDRGYIINETKGNVKTTNLVGIGGVFARQNGNNRDYFLKNAHGDVTAVTNGSTVTKTYEYDAYGVEKNPDENDTNPFRYCGEYFDKESGSIYLRNRYYNPSIPRFITEDSYWRTKDLVYGESALNAANIIKAEYSTYASNETIYQYDYSGETASEIKDKIIKNDPNVLPELIKEYKNVKQTDKYPVAAAIIQSNNLYAYCMNNPVMFIDPTGFDVYFAGANVAAGLGWYISGNAMLVWDDHGNVGIMAGGGIGGGVGVGIGAIAGKYTNLDNIYQLEGMSVSAGVAARLGFEYQGSSGEHAFAVTAGLGMYGTINYGWIILSIKL